ncbi:MAG: hypothetical protein R3A46_07410 [Thermomicrobiales bacterium]
MIERSHAFIVPVLIVALLTVGGALLLQAFADGDREILVYMFIISVVSATVTLPIRGIPKSPSGWLIPIAIAFGPAYLLAIYIAVVLSTSPGMLVAA